MSAENRSGPLEKNGSGRWEFAGYELTSGDAVEIHLSAQWIRGRIEYVHAWKVYALVACSGPDMETTVALHAGMTARLPMSR